MKTLKEINANKNSTNLIANMGMENAITIHLSENRKNPHFIDPYENLNQSNKSKNNQNLHSPNPKSKNHTSANNTRI